MARIAGVELQDKWKIDYALTQIKGIGWTLSKNILNSVKIDASNRVSDLSVKEITKITGKIGDYPIEGALMRQVKRNVARLVTIGSYRGLRHSKGLPVRGQRTRSNARTKRGKRRTVGAFRKEALTRKQQTQKKEE